MSTLESLRSAMKELALCRSRLTIAQTPEAIRQCETALEIAKLNVRITAREHMHIVENEDLRRVLQSESDDARAACSNAARLSSESPSKGSGGDS